MAANLDTTQLNLTQLPAGDTTADVRMLFIALNYLVLELQRLTAEIEDRLQLLE